MCAEAGAMTKVVSALMPTTVMLVSSVVAMVMMPKVMMVTAMPPVAVMPMMAMVPMPMSAVAMIANVDEVELRYRREFDSGAEVGGRGHIWRTPK